MRMKARRLRVGVLCAYDLCGKSDDAYVAHTWVSVFQERPSLHANSG